MTRTWPITAATVAASLLAGALVAGVPGERDDFVVDPVAPTTTIAAVDTTVPVTDPVAPSTDAPTTTVEATTTTSTTVPPTTIDPATGTLDRADVSVVLANGVGVAGLVTTTARDLRLLGYSQITGGDVPERPGRTIVYYLPGFDDEGQRLAQDLGATDAFVIALPDEPVTTLEQSGDLVVILGADLAP